MATESILELTISERLNIFAQYPKNPIAILDGVPWTPDKVEGVDYIQEILIAERTSFDPLLIKLILTPAQKMTDEDALQFAKDFYLGKKDDKVLAIDGKIIVNSFFSNDTEYSPSEFFFIINWLKNKRYAIPVPFGKGHWAENKSLFELGVAIDATKLPLSVE
jgi:hypothetical protein